MSTLMEMRPQDTTRCREPPDGHAPLLDVPMRRRVATWYGLARSAVIYRANLLRRQRARRFYRAFVAPDQLCFDIGAHLGDRTGDFLALGARVVAVEPQPVLIRLLRALYGREKRVILVEAAVGAAPGRAALRLAAANPTVASLSPSWIRRVAQDPAFRGVDWDAEIEVAVTTLAELIDAYGEPAFCKLDVEGSELPALEGLDRPLAALSFEYVAASLDDARAAVARLGEIGRYEFNLSRGESLEFAVERWISAGDLTERLAPLAGPGSGDIYARRLA